MDISTLGTKPISLDKPTGADVRYDPAYDELQAEVDKLSSPAAAGAVDWEKVVGLAADILANKSKDLLVASYFALALTHTRGNEGFADGLKIYLELMETFWEELHPQKVRRRARIRSLAWWLEKTEAALKQGNSLSFPSDKLASIIADLHRLDHFLKERLEDSPSLAPIMGYFHDLSSGSGVTKGIKTPVGTFPETTVEEPFLPANMQQESQIAPSLQEVISLQEADTALNAGLIKIGEASFCLWQHDLAKPQAYRLTRKTAWYAVEELPAAVDGRTKIPPPPFQVKDLLFGLHDNFSAEELLKAAEIRQPQYIFWVDLSRLVAEALTRLGDRFQKAHDAVCQETAFLLHRLPGLEALSFSDGTPFATPDTRQWLRGIAFRETPSTALPLRTAIAAGETEADIENEMGALGQLIGNGELIEAMEVFQRKLRASSSQREMLLRRLSLSRMLLDLDKTRLALPHLEQVLTDIAGHGLEQYDPALALFGFKLAWRAFGSQTEQKFKDRAQDALHRIGRLDMSEMVRLTGGWIDGAPREWPQNYSASMQDT